MWIRSQGKTILSKVRALVISGKTIYGVIDGGENGDSVLGKYESEERALVVLDEIQRQLIVNNTRYTVNEMQRSSAGYVDIDKEEHVYQMPEK